MKSSNGESLPFANVSLLYAIDSSIISGTYTNEKGAYKIDENIPEGKYFLKFSMVGFGSEYETVVVNEIHEEYVVNMVLSETSTALEGLTVTALRKMIKRDNEKMIFSTENIVERGGDALSLLEISPGVIINKSTNIIMLNGKTDITVLLNGKFIGNSKQAIFQVLSGISSGEINRIEIIDNPGAAHEAQGSGIINIVTIKNNASLWNFSIDGGMGYGSGVKYFGSIRASRNIGKFSLSAGYTYNFNDTEEVWSFETIQSDMFTSVESIRDPIVHSHNFNFSVGYSIDSLTNIGLQTRVFNRRWLMLANNTTNIMENSRKNKIISTDDEEDIWNNYILGTFLNRKIGRNGEFSLEVDFLNYKNENEHLYINKLNSNLEEVQLKKNTPFEIIVGKLAYNSTLFSGLNLNIGLKITTTSFSNQFTSTNISNRDLSFEEKTQITEDIGAAWLSLGTKVIDNINITIGLRAETTDINIDDEISQVNLRSNSFLNLFPSASIGFEASENSLFSLNYSRRINRPSYSSLAPFIVFLGPNTVFNGNTLLYPSYSNNFSVVANLSNTNFTLQYRSEENAIIGYQPILNANQNLLEIKPLNFDNSKQILFTYSSQYKLFSIFNLQLNSSLFWESVRDSKLYDGQMYIDNYAAIINGVLTANLGDDFKLQIIGTFKTPILAGFNKNDSPGFINLAIEKKFGDFKLYALVDDLFSTNNWQINGDFPLVNLTLHRNYNWENRIFKLGVLYSLNKIQNEKRYFDGSKEEQQRVW